MEKKVFTLKDLEKYFGGFFNIMMTFVSIWLFVINNQHNIKLSIIDTFRKLYSDVTMYPLYLHQIKLYYVLTWNFGTQYLMYFIRLRFLFKSWPKYFNEGSKIHKIHLTQYWPKRIRYGVQLFSKGLANLWHKKPDSNANRVSPKSIKKTPQKTPMHLLHFFYATH